MVTTQVIIDKVNSMTLITPAEEVLGPEERPMVVQPLPTVETTPGSTEVLTPAATLVGEQPGNTTEIREEATNTEQASSLRRSARIAGGVSQPERYLLLTKVQKANQELKADKEKAKVAAIQKEMLQVFEELQALQPVLKADVPEDAEILRCFIFLVEKFLADGQFDKIKARLVANGAQQNRELYPNKSSPTASIHSVGCLYWEL
jgi:hypothetical protein